MNAVVVVLISEVTECTCMIQSVGGKQFVSSTDVVHFSECLLSEVQLYIHVRTYAFVVVYGMCVCVCSVTACSQRTARWMPE